MMSTCFTLPARGDQIERLLDCQKSFSMEDYRLCECILARGARCVEALCSFPCMGIRCILSLHLIQPQERLNADSYKFIVDSNASHSITKIFDVHSPDIDVMKTNIAVAIANRRNAFKFEFTRVLETD